MGILFTYLLKEYVHSKSAQVFVRRRRLANQIIKKLDNKIEELAEIDGLEDEVASAHQYTVRLNMKLIELRKTSQPGPAES